MGAGAPLYRSSAGKIKEMSRVEEIERAIEELSPDEFRQVAQRVHDIEAERWDKELDRDAAAGKLEKMGVKIVPDVDKPGFQAIADPYLDKLAHDLGPHAEKIKTLIRAIN